jgi:hypothetical protein
MYNSPAVSWPFSITRNCVVSRTPSRSGFDRSSLQARAAEEVVRVSGHPTGNRHCNACHRPLLASLCFPSLKQNKEFWKPLAY